MKDSIYLVQNYEAAELSQFSTTQEAEDYVVDLVEEGTDPDRLTVFKAKKMALNITHTITVNDVSIHPQR